MMKTTAAAPRCLALALAFGGALLSNFGAQAREVFSVNQRWEFFRPPTPVPWSPAPALLIARGEFPVGIAPQTLKFAPQQARYLCLESLAAHQGPFAAVAELDLLGADGQPLPHEDWKVIYADSEEREVGDLATNAIDGKPATKWHSAWKTKAPPPPHCLVIDLGQVRSFAGFRYLPRQDGNLSGMLKSWRFYASEQPFSLPATTQPADPLTGSVSWETVNLPHAVRLEPLNASGGRNYQGVCWYRRSLVAEKQWQDRPVYLHFEGTMQVADVWCNGEKLATHHGGYQPFTVDLTQHLRFGGQTNILLVKLDNSDNSEVPPGKPQNQLDFTYFGGLYRNVRLEVLDPLHITDELLANQVGGGGIFVRYPEVTAARAVVSVQTEVVNEHPVSSACLVRQDLCDAGGKVVSSDTQAASLPAQARQTLLQNFEVAAPRLWHPNHPDLYTLRTTVLLNGQAVDTRTTRLGLRRIQFSPQGMLINGEKFFSQGFNRHQDHPYVGYALSDAQHYRDAKKMRDAGMTSFRSHYPQAPAFMDACDELGILGIVSNPGWQFFGNETWVERVHQNAREMVRLNRNHPSAVIWEPFPNETGYSEAFARSLYQVVHAEYPGEQCFVAGDGELGQAKNFLELLWSREQITGKPCWGREWGDSVDNWSDQQGRVRVARGWGEVPLITQAINHALKLDTMLRNAGGGPAATALSGACVWAGIDCYRGYHAQPFYGGPLDLFRLPKFDYYFFQSQREPMVQISGVDCGPMVFIANYASAYSPATVTVFSNCEEVRFLENGKLVATQKPDAGYVLAHPPFTFQAKAANVERSTYYMSRDNAANAEYGYHYQAARYEGEGLLGGQVVARHIVQAPGVMQKLTLEVDYAGRGLTADGADWIRVYARVCDARGTVHPFADDMITFTVEGAGSLIGDATIGANPVRPEAGIATALVRATTQPGPITIRASASGLQSAEAVIHTQPFQGKISP